MNLVLLSESDFAGPATVRLQGRRRDHAAAVLKASVGDSLTVGLVNGRVGSGTVTSLTLQSLEMTVALDRQPPQPLPVTLVLALPRPKMLRRVLFCAASMGVKRIWLINACRVEKSFWQSPTLSAPKIREQLVLGLEQARDTVLPEVSLRPLFRPFVEDELPDLMAGTLGLVAHPGAEADCPRSPDTGITLVIGPEGGFVPYEIEKLRSLGITPVSLGQRTLRVETVVPALLARLC